MSFNTHNLEAVIANKISAGGATELELLQYKKALAQIKAGDIQTVASFNSLPPATESLGKIFYVEDEEILYWYNPTLGAYVNLKFNVASQLFGGGNNGSGQLGNESTVSVVTPVQEISSSVDWSYVSAGNENTYGLKTDSTLWGMGGGTIFCVSGISSPIQEYSSSSWIDVEGKCSGGFAIKTDGTLWGWGSNQCGALGDGTISDRTQLTQEVTADVNWCKIVSHSHTGGTGAYAIKTDGTLWSWGSNQYGKLAVNDVVDRSSPTQEVSSSTNWCASGASIYAAAAIKTDGTMWGWGVDFYSVNFTNVDTSSPVQEPLLSTSWCLLHMTPSGNQAYTGSAIKTDGTLWSWGYNAKGQFGSNTSADSGTPIQEVTSSTNWLDVSHSYENTGAIKTDGTLWGWGCTIHGAWGIDAACPDYSSPVQEVGSSTNWSQISGGWAHFVGIKCTSL